MRERQGTFPPTGSTACRPRPSGNTPVGPARAPRPPSATRSATTRRTSGGVDPDLYLARDTATKSEHGDISRVRRGGCWADDGWACRSAFRLRFEPDRRYDHIGFRIVAVKM
ncbi:MAG: hypothetical protein FJW27_04525 [Acidimicrobiia bacterium]|nr:hypothetical protein [Acidimicrobiia bacterium]